ncbi:MAG: ABC transporter ATP-binding protein [candidate division WOR-3 bacterium]
MISNLLFLILFTIILKFLLGFVDPIAFKLLIDYGIMGKNLKLFIIISVIVILLGTLLRYLNFLQEVLVQKFKNKVLRKEVLNAIENFFDIPYSKIVNNSAYFLSRIYDERKEFVFQKIEILLNLVGSLTLSIVSLFILLFISWKITLILLVIIPVLYILSQKLGSKITSLSELEKEKEAKLREDLVKVISSYRAIKIFNLFEVLFKNVTEKIDKFFEMLLKRTKTSAFYRTSSDIFLSYAEFSVFIFLGIGVILGILTIGDLFAFTQAFWKFMNGVMEIISYFPVIFSLKGIEKRMKEFEALRKNELKVYSNNEIILNNISFGFDENKILKNFSIKIPLKKKILISGPNGSGKTTLLNIISGFLSPEGDIKIPPLEKISAMIMPLEFIPGNLKDNVNFENLSENKRKKFMELLEKFNLKEKINMEPYELSEGEKRKFAIIRTILKDAEIYIFDEPLAGIDVESKDEVMRTIFEETKDKTVIIVMHGDDKYNALFDEVINIKKEGAYA